MKKHIPIIITVVSCVISAVCLVRIAELKNDVRNLEWIINDRVSDVQNKLWNITYEIEKTLEQQASLVSESGWDFSDITAEDIQTETALVKCYVVPKEYREDNTEVYIYCNDIAVPMTFENGKFTAEIQVPFFAESIVDKVQLKESGEIKTEMLGWYINPKENILPAFYSDGPGYRLSYKDDYVQLEYSSDINIHIEHRGVDYKKQVVFVATLDGEKVYEQIIELDNPVHSDEYTDVYSTEEINGKFDIKYGSEVESYIEFRDGNDLIYRYRLEKMILDKNGTQSSIEALLDGCDIYKADGTPLFVIER